MRFRAPELFEQKVKPVQQFYRMSRAALVLTYF